MANDGDVPLRPVTTDEPAVVDAYHRPLTLVRPDGFVAWQGDVVDAAEAERILARVTGTR